MKIRRFEKYDWLLLAYIPVYTLWFVLLEHLVTTDYTVMHCVLDDYIPFCAPMVYFYVAWYFYLAAFAVYSLLRCHRDFRCAMLQFVLGSAICMFICTVFPNGQNMRPETVNETGLTGWLFSWLYSADTPTNVFPSMHVVGSLAVAFTISKSRVLGKKKLLNIAAWVLCVLICASTMFIKQHSALDVLGGAAVGIIVYLLTYWLIEPQFLKKHPVQRQQ